MSESKGHDSAHHKEVTPLYHHMDEGLTPMVILGMFLCIIVAVLTVIILRKKKLTSPIRITIFSFVILFFGVFLYAKLGVMEAIVKLFKATAGKDSWYLKVLYLSFFSILSIITSNLFCSIGCQIGVLQDFIFQLFRFKKIKYKKTPFWFSNGVRIILFIIFLLFIYDILTGLKSGSLYHNLNIFKIYILNLGTIGIITFVFTVFFSGFIYRPFCSLICPFGLWSWILSHISVFKINRDVCIECEKCITACPNNSMKSIYKNNFIKMDCYSYGECINKCP